MARRLGSLILGVIVFAAPTGSLKAESRSIDELAKIVATQQVLIVEMQMQLAKLKSKVCTAESSKPSEASLANEENAASKKTAGN